MRAYIALGKMMGNVFRLGNRSFFTGRGGSGFWGEGADQPILATTSAIDITLDQLPTLTRNQKVNVKATITKGGAEPKQV